MSRDAPKVSLVETPYQPDEATDVESVVYAADGLSVIVGSPAWRVRVFFEQTYGLRVLDELDLTEFWSECSLADGWFYEVASGGWKGLEITRRSFMSGRQSWVREYLVIGRNECVSVFTKEQPVVIPEPPSSPSYMDSPTTAKT